jgi:hypothetical protein
VAGATAPANRQTVHSVRCEKAQREEGRNDEHTPGQRRQGAESDWRKCADRFIEAEYPTHDKLLVDMAHVAKLGEAVGCSEGEILRGR